MKLLGVFTHGPGQMYNTKRAITKVSDIAGLKIRTGGGVADLMAKELGASAFVKPAPKSYELLSSGVADGVFFPLEFDHLLQARHGPEARHDLPRRVLQLGVRLVHERGQVGQTLEAGPGHHRRRIGEKLATLAGNTWDEADAAGLAQMKKSGIQITEPDAAFVKDVMSKATKLEQDWIKAANAKGVDGAKVLAEFRAELKKVEAEVGKK